MDENRFFRFIWRVNALAFLVLLLLVLAMLGWEFMPKGLFGKPRVTEVVNVDETDDTITETFDLHVAQRVPGHYLFHVVEELEQEFDRGYSSNGTYSNSINSGIYNPETGRTNWFFPTRNQLITDIAEISTEIHTETSSITRLDYYLVTYVSADTSEDLRLSDGDDKTVMLVNPSGTKSKVILSGLMNDPSIWALKDDQYALFFRDKTGLKSTLLDTNTMAIGEVREVGGR